MALRRKRAGGAKLGRRLTALMASLLLPALLTGCVRRCSFCGERTIFFDCVHLHGAELIICSECQYW